MLANASTLVQQNSLNKVSKQIEAINLTGECESPLPPDNGSNQSQKIRELPTSSTKKHNSSTQHVHQYSISRGIVVDENTDENSLVRLMDNISDISYKGHRDPLFSKSSFSTEQKISSYKPTIALDCAPPSQAVSEEGDQMSFSEVDDPESSFIEPTVLKYPTKKSSSTSKQSSVSEDNVEPIDPLSI